MREQRSGGERPLWSSFRRRMGPVAAPPSHRQTEGLRHDSSLVVVLDQDAEQEHEERREDRRARAERAALYGVNGGGGVQGRDRWVVCHDCACGAGSSTSASRVLKSAARRSILRLGKRSRSRAVQAAHALRRARRSRAAPLRNAAASARRSPARRSPHRDSQDAAASLRTFTAFYATIDQAIMLSGLRAEPPGECRQQQCPVRSHSLATPHMATVSALLP